MRILIVDDIEENLYLLESLLKGSGYEVVAAKDGVEALNKLKEKSIDIIVSDILMPKMDGFQFCRECKKDDSFKNIPFVFYTATYIDKKDEEFALSLGAEKFIVKPQEPQAFLKIIEEVIEEYQKGTLIAPKEPIKEEEIYFAKYNKRLIQKLEKKMLDLTKSDKLIEHLYSVLKAIRGVNRLIIKEKNISALLQKVCDVLIGARDYNAAWLGLLKDERNFAIVVGSPPTTDVYHFCKQVLRRDYPPCIKKAFIQKDLFMIVDRSKECVDCPLKDKHSGKQSAIMRIEHSRKFFGLLEIILAPDVYINEEEKGLLEELAGDIAFGLHNIELEDKDKLSEQKLQQSYQRLKKTMDATIDTMSRIIEAKDPYTSGHQHRVCQLAVPLARELGLTEDRVEGVRIASLIHDIGKIGLPTEILSKPGKLSDIEFSLIKDHSLVLQHHERLNGSGYPNKLNGDKIILEAKIIGVADVVEAMSSFRPYRPALGVDAALEEITQNRGILYDPEVVDVCLKLFKEKRFEFE